MITAGTIVLTVIVLVIAALLMREPDARVERGTAAGVAVSASVFYDPSAKRGEYYFSDLEKLDASPIRIYAPDVSAAWLLFGDCENDHKNAQTVAALSSKWACFRFTSVKN